MPELSGDRSWPLGIGVEQVVGEGQIVDDRDGPLGRVERLDGEPDQRVCALGFEVGKHGFGVEWGSVVEGDAFAQRDGPRRVLGVGRERLGQERDPLAVGGERRQRVEHGVAHDQTVDRHRRRRRVDAVGIAGNRIAKGAAGDRVGVLLGRQGLDDRAAIRLVLVGRLSGRLVGGLVGGSVGRVGLLGDLLGSGVIVVASTGSCQQCGGDRERDETQPSVTDGSTCCSHVVTSFPWGGGAHGCAHGCDRRYMGSVGHPPSTALRSPTSDAAGGTVAG